MVTIIIIILKYDLVGFLTSSMTTEASDDNAMEDVE